MKKFFVLLLLLPSLLVGCIAEDLGPEIPDTGEIVLDCMEIILPASGEDAFYIHVVSPYAWSAQSSVEWISFENNKGEAGSSYLCMSVSENTEPIKRQGVIYFTTDDYNLTAELLVTQNTGSPKQLLLVADKTTIYDNGEDAVTFSLYYDGMQLKEGYEIYDGETLIPGNTFTSTVQGTHTIWAAYGTVLSNDVSISVVQAPPTGPTVPEDKYPSKTNFKRRVLLTQFTGTGCGYCPNMVNALYQVTSVKSLNDKIVLAAAHLYNANDPAYLLDAKTLDNSLGVQGFPCIYADLNNATATSASYAAVTKLINDSYARTEAKGGIAVNSKYYEQEGYIVLHATVKANTSTAFRIGAWLLEDNISGVQANYGTTPLAGVNLDIHNNCIRFADSQYSNMDYSGVFLANIEAGKTASKWFAFKMEKNWKPENLRVIVFISTKEGNKWLVNNVVKCPKDGSVDFEYTE